MGESNLQETEYRLRSAHLDDLTGLVARGKLHHTELGLPWAYDEESTAFSVLKLISAETLIVEETLKGYIGYEVGSIYFNLHERLATEHFWYTLPAYRSTGLGMALLEAAQTRATVQGATWFSTQLPPASEKAVKVAEQMGFEPMHTIYGKRLWPDQSSVTSLAV